MMENGESMRKSDKNTIKVLFRINRNHKNVCTQDIEKILPALDFREKNGYTRTVVTVYEDAKCSVEKCKAILYYAQRGDDPAYTGPSSDKEVATIIANAVGPSGPNIDYLSNLMTWCKDKNVHDEHITTLAELAVSNSNK
eukprot:m.237978 g.237978  ORF g.237978 m.237978 type:complete len:140 (-) comp16058_c0_seq9:2051-2470(-)